MYFGLNDEQQEIKRNARDLLMKRSPLTEVRAGVERGAYDPDLWREFCHLGWPGTAIEEQHGGLGLGTIEAAVLVEEAGAALAGSPLLPTLNTAFVLQEAGSATQRDEWLPRLASGETTGAVGLSTDGSAVGLPDASDADVLVLIEGGRASLYLRSEVEVEPFEAIDLTRRYGSVAAHAGAGEPLPGNPGLAIARAKILVAAELVGVCQRALDLTVAYVKERRQFGKPVGAFQAVAHRCTDMLIATEGARSTAAFGAWAADADAAQLARAAALAKAVSSAAALEVTGSAIQAYGGIGFTWESDVHWLYKRAQLDAQLYGGAHYHWRVLASLMRSPTATAAS